MSISLCSGSDKEYGSSFVLKQCSLLPVHGSYTNTEFLLVVYELILLFIGWVKSLFARNTQVVSNVAPQLAQNLAVGGLLVPQCEQKG